MESYQELHFNPSMEGMATTTFNNHHQSSNSMEDQDTEYTAPPFFSSFTSYDPHSSGAPIQIPQFNTNVARTSHPYSNNLVSPLNQNPPPTTFSSPKIISFGIETSTKKEEISYNLSSACTNQRAFFPCDHQDMKFHEIMHGNCNVYLLENEGEGYNVGKNRVLKRSREQATYHAATERKRRVALRERFIALSKIVPGIRKLDNSTILEGANKHIKELQERVKILEEGINNKTITLISHVEDGEEQQYGVSPNVTTIEEDMLPEIKVTVLEKDVLVKILCHKRFQNCVSNMSEELKKLHLTIFHTSVLHFGGCAIDITFGAKVETQFSNTVHDIVKCLRVVVSEAQTTYS
ncbi:OLC1v1022593C1 [Oldenlandia corymbosa var. corymbosa]|uniref:OLC1v1022593C1 n=1 Tax=Oldenlandia corymbosa var. corymbosa TaxID=529605 RepID=A0AAV1BYF3_OLDCO|nr:OLC1v1022593C1 [Oldenlandia corymbosa var. corymbosa]